MKIIAVLLNPIIDEIFTIENFHIGGTFKVLKKVIYPVGKAISFSLGVQELTADEKIVKIIALIGVDEISLYSSFLKSRNIKFEFVKVDGKTRSNKTINDPITGTTTHIREKGFVIKKSEERELKKILNNNIKTGDIVVFSGSIPLGVDENIYYELIKLSKERGAMTILDSSGQPLIKGLKANPNIIKPNLVELAQILQDPTLKEMLLTDLPDESEIIAEKAERLLNAQLSQILITLGKNGAICLMKNMIYFGHVKVNKVLDTVGSGDSFLAGFVLNYIFKKDELECFKFGLACGAANTLIPGPGIFKIKDVNRILKNVEIIRLN